MSDQPGAHAEPAKPHHQSFWLWVMCLTGVDYFSTLGYQPSIAYENAGLLAPLATIVLVLVTLFGALPIYWYVCGRSHGGQGSIGMLAKLVSGWGGKVLVLTLLGFAATDFVITKTLSGADAAVHLITNPNWPLEVPDDDEKTRQAIYVTGFLLMLLGASFMRGFREVIGLAVVIVGAYLLLSGIVIGAGVAHLVKHPEAFHQLIEHIRAGEWYLKESERPLAGTGLFTIIAISLIIFPKLALGLSGFETGVAVMPLVKGRPTDDPKDPKGRVANTRKLLITAAAIMSVYLVCSSVVVACLVPPEHLVKVNAAGAERDGVADKELKAKDRALAYLAHGENREGKLLPFFGDEFGTVYDIATVIILWFAGASAMAGLLNLVPQYLPRYGMAPEWTRATRPLVLMFTVINLIVTVIFRANVDAQSAAYATGVLVLITSGCVASVIDIWQRRTGRWYSRLCWPFLLITLVFVYTTIANVFEKPDGIKIAAFFILAILVTSFWSRWARSRELRFAGFKLPDAESRLMWDTIRDLELTVLVPHRPGRRSLANKEGQIRREHRIPRDLMIVFVEVELDDTSDFVNEPELRVTREEGRYVVKITGAASIAHTLAALALEMAKVGRPPEVHFGWTDDSPVSGTLGFLLFGEGNVPWMVRDLIRRAQPDESKRPLIIIAGTA
ncbi:Amino acid transporter OS=Streptomyces sp. AA4 GN=SSMG_00131 PE=4 SV=1 [Gemmata massiliana]|uniref:Amino acid transporter n=1 Tax=Gemmata massiliana TaxID=1210884 RepID=A0A6P2CZN6_9BACT|nr:amino acid transporter [Gemmata massiliana]VTR94451.1 Amino acid transporter OS=Streptomyces sp. AA4 GN=SSMG_00131 PE=4 SV=1 [Gemmata massiliana]